MHLFDRSSLQGCTPGPLRERWRSLAPLCSTAATAQHCTAHSTAQHSSRAARCCTEAQFLWRRLLLLRQHCGLLQLRTCCCAAASTVAKAALASAAARAASAASPSAGASPESVPPSSAQSGRAGAACSAQTERVQAAARAGPVPGCSTRGGRAAPAAASCCAERARPFPPPPPRRPAAACASRRTRSSYTRQGWAHPSHACEQMARRQPPWPRGSRPAPPAPARRAPPPPPCLRRPSAPRRRWHPRRRPAPARLWARDRMQAAAEGETAGRSRERQQEGCQKGQRVATGKASPASPAPLLCPQRPQRGRQRSRARPTAPSTACAPQQDLRRCSLTRGHARLGGQAKLRAREHHAALHKRSSAHTTLIATSFCREPRQGAEHEPEWREHAQPAACTQSHGALLRCSPWADSSAMAHRSGRGQAGTRTLHSAARVRPPARLASKRGQAGLHGSETCRACLHAAQQRHHALPAVQPHGDRHILRGREGAGRGRGQAQVSSSLVRASFAQIAERQ